MPSRKHILGSVDRSLEALADPLMTADELAEAFAALRQAGKAPGTLL